ncbi:aldo/keto reductase [Actinocatenispora comari]|jgi:aryl-alcohol dehydrogenase-like predicted oxidoreductase|uniref:Oxidoreductase n=1 Tax=Actinocatenispora comari TaxID=2807577 RepID=A0A8J4AHK3_9ACTN|nr:aldo/keto reductase [Actinocatenispora comari]GIL31676.1 oxidoreductase [Actinocatenispora comari]
MGTSECDAGSWTLGDRTVHRIGLGVKRLAAGTSDPGTAQERAIALLRRAVELGVDHLDTAAFYPTYADDGDPAHAFRSLGWANEVIRAALAPYPEHLTIVTKIGPTGHGLARPDELRGLVEAELRQLGVDHLDVVNLRLHGLDSIAEHFGVLAELRDAGLIRHLGLSNVRPQHLAQAQQIAPVVCVQNRYGVDFGRVNDELVDSCGAQHIAFVPFFALTATGREAGGVGANETVTAIARAHDATPAQVRIAWTLGRGPHVLAIPGTGDPRHLAENLAAGALRLSPAETAALDAAS